MSRPAASSPVSAGCPQHSRAILVKKNIFISKKKPFLVSTGACTLRKCTYPYPGRVQGAPSLVLDAISQPGLSLPLELLPGSSYGHAANVVAYSQVKVDMIADGHIWLQKVCLLARILSVLPGLRKRCFYQ